MTTESLFDKFLAESNFLAAFHRVKAKKSVGGIDRVSVDDFEHRLHQNIRRLRKEIRNDSYVPQPVQAVFKQKFNEKNEFRELGLPVVSDKVVQTALLQVVEPLAEKRFLDTSYGYRKDKSSQKAIRRIEHNLVAGKLNWTVHQDVDNFFDTLAHDRLLRIFADLVGHDQRLVELAALWCRCGIVAKSGRWRNVETGVRQGQVISPLLANLYLHELDEFVQQKGWGWVRYADDYLVQVKSELEAKEADQEITSFVKQSLGLRLNANENPVASLDQGFTFLGVFFKGTERVIADKKIAKMQSKIDWLLSPKNKNGAEKVLDDLRVMVDGWVKYYGFLNPKAQFAGLESKIEERLANLINQRVKSGGWSKKPPDGACLFLLTAPTAAPTEGEQRLRHIWKEALPQATPEPAAKNDKVKKQADRKIGVRRRQHQRQQAAEGEIIVTSPGHFVGRRGERIIVRRQQNVVVEVPGARFTGLTMAEHGLSLSTDVISFCSEKNITIHFIDSLGKIFAVAHRPDGIRADLVLKQVSHRDDKMGLQLARMFIWGKVRNQLAVLKSYAKYRGHREDGFGRAYGQIKGEMETVAGRIKTLPQKGSPEEFRNTLLGLEGTVGARYWQLISYIIPAEYEFHGRERQGAKDLVNSLLNYGYGILYAQTLTAVIKAGLNAKAGFLHAYQSNKPVLTYDLVEEFRAPVVDRAIFSMLNRHEQLGQEENGFLDPGSRKKVAAAVTTRLGSEAIHRGRKDTLKNILHGQAMAVRDFLNGKGGYKPFLARW